ncbi:MAG: cobalamin-binding protein [Desulfobacterales bacterium]|jgi:iron complex transport system substrate-binding protein
MYLKNLIAVLVALILLSCMSAAAKTVKDQLGRNVDVPDEPKRIVALAPSITEIIFQLNQAHRLKGVTQFSNYPPEALALPKVGSYIRLDLERIVALDPDLCIGIKDGNPKEIVARLQSMKIPVYVVDPRNLDTVIETILEIGQLLNAFERANLLAKTMGNRLQQVKKIAAQSEKRPRVFMQIGISPIVAAGSKTFVHDLILKAGGINVAAGSTAYPRFSREQVLALAPEIIIITSMARQGDFEQVKRDWSQWPNLPAARNQSIFLVDSDVFNRPSPRLIDGLELLVKLIHPESFEQNQ